MRARGLLIAGIVALAVGLLGIAVLPAIAAPAAWSGWGFGPGPGRWGPAHMVGTPGMGWMMGGPVAANARPIGIERAADSARAYIAGFGDPNLELAEVMEFAANYYAQAIERDTEVHAFEILIDKYSGTAFPEMGPNMVWNTRYGMMGGMMGWRGPAGASADMPIGPERARDLAMEYLLAQGLQMDVHEPDRFYGYYTLHTLRDGEIEGMLSVNGFTGEVWYHAWHGPFVREMEPSAGTVQAKG